jgi:hypothetical protein
MSSVFSRIARSACAAGAIAAALAVPVRAQEATAPRSRTAQQAPAPVAARTVQADANQTKRDFYQVLDQYPPAVGRVLRLDPTLMTNPSYLESYPNIAAFLAQNPDVARNPGFYLDRYESSYIESQPPDPRRESLRMWRDAMEFLGAFSVFCVVMIALFGLIKYIMEYRRWGRISKVNAEVHNKILDRFGSNEELLAYVDSPAGRRFLEATPITPSAAPSQSVAAPYGRILLSVQIGVILLALAAGFVGISAYSIEEVQPVLNGLAVLALCLGVGSIASAVASYLLSRKLGLLPEAAARPEHTA